MAVVVQCVVIFTAPGYLRSGRAAGLPNIFQSLSKVFGDLPITFKIISQNIRAIMAKIKLPKKTS